MNHHLFIGGTGRAGTSFLVQYLTACGIETHLTLNPHQQLDEHANAGLEDYPTEGLRLPYVIKSPWLFEFVDALVERQDIAIDAVILPMRDIVEAASSRVILEMRARYGDGRFVDDVCQWESWGLTPGGVVYSLNPLDQARILAMGFHQTIYALVRKNIPIYFVDFGHMIEDAKYLWTALEPILCKTTDRAGAIAAHARTADATKVRVSREESKEEGSVMPFGMAPVPTSGNVRHTTHASLDRAALLRELHSERLKRSVAETKLAEAKDALVQSELRANELHAVQSAMRNTEAEWQATQATLEARLYRVGQASEQVALELAERTARHADEMQRANREHAECLHAMQEQQSGTMAEMNEIIVRLRDEITSLRASSSWRVTSPLRKARVLLSRIGV
jgi:hypothetical protein